VLWQFEMRQAGAFLDDIAQIGKKRVIAIRLVETVVSVGPARDNTSRAQNGQFLLDRAQGESAHHHEFADVSLDSRVRKEQAQDCRTCFRKQQINNPVLRFHIFAIKSSCALINLTGLTSQVLNGLAHSIQQVA
jgi:hypothetical protein